jgi:predicted nucleic acid-binding protein
MKSFWNTKKYFKKKTGEIVAGNMIDFFTAHPFVKMFEPFYKFQLITQDKDDNKFVDCAIAANASCIVTNDKHFNEVKQHKLPTATVLNIIEFEKKFR